MIGSELPVKWRLGTETVAVHLLLQIAVQLPICYWLFLPLLRLIAGGSKAMHSLRRLHFRVVMWSFAGFPNQAASQMAALGL